MAPRNTGENMSGGVGYPRVGQWYSRADKGEMFQVTGRDDQARTIEIQSFDGDVDEIDEDAWTTLRLAFAEPPEDWTGPVDRIETDDLGYSETGMRLTDWEQPLQTLKPAEPRETWDEIDEAQ